MLLKQFYTAGQDVNEDAGMCTQRLQVIVSHVHVRQSTPFTPKTAEEMLRTKFWSRLRDPALKNALRNKMDAGLAFDDPIVSARTCELEVNSTEQTCNSQFKLKQLSACGHMKQKFDSLVRELTEVRDRITQLESQPVEQPPTTTVPHSTPSRFRGKCYKCGKTGHKKAQCPYKSSN